MTRAIDVPVWNRTLLTVEEAAAYTGVGQIKLKEISNDENCQFVLWIGTKRMFKREKLDKWLEDQYSI